MASLLLDVKKVDTGIEPFLDQTGKVFHSFRRQDSGCVSYGVEAGGRCWFVKHSEEPRGIESLRRARQIYTSVCHPALPQLYNVFETANGQALVLEWLPGENLYDYTAGKGKAAREDPHSPQARFRALPVRLILEALDTIYDAHLSIAAHGFIAVDFYDGCILYDFEQARTYLFDLDEYRLGPFTNESDRLPGSRRFMAPEEFQRGARIDLVTNVFTLGRAALQLLGDGTPDAGGWRGSQAMLAVAVRATDPQRERRYPDVRDFVEHWRKAVREDQQIEIRITGESQNMTERQTIKTENAPRAIGPYSQGILAGNLVFTAGQIGLDPEKGEIVPGGIEAETRKVLQNLKGVLEAAGSSLDRVVKTTVFLRDMGEFARMNSVYAEFFSGDFPARTTVQVTALPKNAAVEIEAVALVG